MPSNIACPECAAQLKVNDPTPGKKLRCPKCKAVFPIPAPPAKKRAKPDVVEEVIDEEVIDEEVIDEEVIDEEVTDEAVEEGEPKSRSKGKDKRGDTKKKRRRPDDDDDGLDDDGLGDDKARPRADYMPCPSCDSDRIKKVVWTPWGSFYGPAIMCHVRCKDCGYTYNGRSGRSNLIPAILFVSVPLIAIMGVLIWVFIVLRRLGYLGGAPAD